MTISNSPLLDRCTLIVPYKRCIESIHRHQATGHQNADSFASAAQSRRNSGVCCRRAQCCSCTATTTLPRYRPLCYSALALPTAHLCRHSPSINLLALPNTTLRVTISVRPKLSPVHGYLCVNVFCTTLNPRLLNPNPSANLPSQLSRP